MNLNLRELQLILLDRVRLLSKQLDNVTDPDKAKKILDEMQEFNHRVTLVGGMLFCQQSQELDNKIDAVRQEKSKVDRAIRDIDNLTNMLQIASNFLSLVDEVIDLAKMIL
jgi:hypothetical protein